ncbi:hypothetical protein KR018_010264, partial [Drosophila ironensis]
HSDDQYVLLEEQSFEAIEVENSLQEEVQDQEFRHSRMEISPEQHSGPYQFLRNWRNAGVWMCILYNFIIILILAAIYFYRRKK